MMKARKSIIAAVAVSLTGLVAVALSGCEWFSFEKRGKAKDVAASLGHDETTASWLASKATSPRSDALQLYLDACNANQIDPDEVSFLDFLKALNDDSASLTSPLRASVAIRTPSSAGSGVIYSIDEPENGYANAYVITNYHVTYGSSAYYTYFYGDNYNEQPNAENSPALRATYVGGAMDEDIAVLSIRIPQSRLSFVQSIVGDFDRRDSDDVNVGEKVYAVGNTLGCGISVVSGIVSVEAEYNTFSKISDSRQPVDMLTMRIDAPVMHGNSGGGLFDRNGNLVGIVNGGKESAPNGNETIDVDGYGFAIPANRAVAVAQSVIDNAAVNDSQAAFAARLGEFRIQSSEGRFDSATNTIEIVERVEITAVNSGSPFGGEIVGKILTGITVGNESGEFEYEITRMHQIATILFNIRKDDAVVLTFSDGSSTEPQTYDDAYRHFEQLG